MKKIKVPSNVLKSARELQANYRRLKVASTQNVRNAFPMHKLVMCVLPTHSPEKATAIRQVLMTRPASMTALGKRFARQYAKEFGLVRSEAGMTATEICDTLNAKGFMANKFSVRSALSNLRGTVGSFPTPAPQGVRGKGESLYFVRS
jgi:hypothetical protein